MNYQWLYCTYASCDVIRLVPPVPVIDSVSAMALSLSAFRVNITLLTDGGQRVTLYTVSVCVRVCVSVCVYMCVCYVH